MLVRVLFNCIAIVGCLCLFGEQTQAQQTTLKLGVAYQSKGDGNWVSVAEILPKESLSGTGGWVQVKPLENHFQKTIATTCRTEWVNGKWCTREWKVDLIGESGAVSIIEGIHEIPEILNRPLFGDITVRSEELKISQLRNQLREAISSSESKMPCSMCVSMTQLNNPTLRMGGYASTDSAAAIAQVYAKKLGLRLNGVAGPDKSGDYWAELDGAVTVSGAFRPLKDTVPQFGRERLFYLDDKEEQVHLVAETDSAKLMLIQK
jgi:hypothetical protein